MPPTRPMTEALARQPLQRSVSCRVEGRVQGVFFRSSTSTEANRLGVVGRVRNLEDGAVEVLAQGKPEAVAALIGWLWRGSPLSRVVAVTVTDAEPITFSDFVSA